MIVVAGPGALFALIARDDAWHERVRNWWAATAARVVVPSTSAAVTARLVGTRLAPWLEQRFIQDMAQGEFELAELEPADLDRAARLMAAYQDLPLTFLDASLVAIAERMDCRDILTTDRRYLPGIRPRQGGRLRLLP